jgi:hypothetical protein
VGAQNKGLGSADHLLLLGMYPRVFNHPEKQLAVILQSADDCKNLSFANAPFIAFAIVVHQPDGLSK